MAVSRPWRAWEGVRYWGVKAMALENRECSAIVQSVVNNQGRCGSSADQDRFSRTAPAIGRRIHVGADPLLFVVTMITLIIVVGHLQ
jgi:hypothetical protein